MSDRKTRGATHAKTRPPRPAGSAAAERGGDQEHWWSRKPPRERRPWGKRALWNLWEFRHPWRVYLAGLAVFVVVGMIASVFLVDSGGGGDQAAAGGDVEVAGTALAPLPASGDDPAVGQPMPTLSGTTLDGEDLVAPASGRPTLILYVAHWCPHCQREVPTVQQWVDDGGLPDGVDLVTVSTAIDPRRPNYPPAAWLESEGWTAPVLTDGDGAAATAAGLTAYPYFVAVDAEGRVAVRASGELTTGQLDAVVAEITDQ
jgi:thiol-disulfide isomerase/thioredoxin